MRFFIYSRKSVITGKGESIENQIEMCKQYISAKFPNPSELEIVIYEDEGFSAKNTARPRFQQMLRDIQQNKPDYIVCYRLDRISRNVSDFSALIEELNSRSISFVCIKEEFDTSKPMGKAMMYIASVFAQLERETIAERVRDNMLMLARTGRWLGGAPPTGYTSEKNQKIMIDGKVTTSCRLKDNPQELTSVDLIFEKFLELRSISGVSKHLIRKGIKSRNGNDYSLLGIKQILQNPVYCIADREAFSYFTEKHADVCFREQDCSNQYGLLVYNKRNYQKKHAPRQPVDQWIVAIGRHRGRISGEKWVTVQHIIEDNIPTGKKPAKMHNDYSLLSGMIYCEKCGSRMFAKQRSGKAASSGQFDYLCGSKLRGGKMLCSCQNINGAQADDMVCQALMPYTTESTEIYKLLEKLRRDLRRQKKDDLLAQIQAKMNQCTEEMNRLIRSLSQTDPSPVLIRHVSDRMSELDQTVTELTAESRRLQTDISLSDQAAQTDMLVRTLSGFKRYFSQLSIHEKRILIKLLVQKIVWDGENLHIFICGD